MPGLATQPPAKGTGPRAAGRVETLTHRTLAYRDVGFPVVVPVELAGHDQASLRLVAAPGLLPARCSAGVPARPRPTGGS
ncbi:MAG: hypothetical protein ACLQFR_25890 [Streptosporangiaceae bacterium]